ncbi:hypothetical protein HUK38_13380 [Thiospirillum jenense]|uniref:CHAT domain-containing protein n=1 Tax=Thiospirillum jenense TaxID=1653858 RepID=A0A839HKH6_9GAMM|nr:hypothetical protein [Thiospirillum jenense]
MAQQLPAQTLQNQDFLLKRFVTEMQDQSYQMVHIASHGLFQGTPRTTLLSPMIVNWI